MIEEKEKLIDDYAQAVVEDMEIGDMMDVVKESIEQRLMDMPEKDMISEIKDSAYDIIDDES